MNESDSLSSDESVWSPFYNNFESTIIKIWNFKLENVFQSQNFSDFDKIDPQIRSFQKLLRY